jgi:hypothetical protein
MYMYMYINMYTVQNLPGFLGGKGILVEFYIIVHVYVTIANIQVRGISNCTILTMQDAWAGHADDQFATSSVSWVNLPGNTTTVSQLHKVSQHTYLYQFN